jgi:hypothetical protein
MLGEGDEGAVGAEDAGFFAGDFGDGGAEVVLMVESDVGDDGEEGMDDVGGVEPAAEADFEDGDVDGMAGAAVGGAIGEVEEGEGGEGLEKAGVVRELAGGDEAVGGLVDAEVEAGESLLGNFEEAGSRFEVRGSRWVRGARCGDADALGDAGEVGRGVEAGAEAGGGEDAGERGRRGALAVGAGDEDGGEAGLRVAERAGEDAHVLQVEFAAGRGGRKLRGESEQMVDRRSEGHEPYFSVLFGGIPRPIGCRAKS